jgi:hypothetical protein
MREFVSTLREMNSDIKFYCLTQMNYSFGLRAKEKFVHEYYGEDFKVISCGVKELKTESLNIIQYVEDIENKSEILLVDDIWETVDKTIDCGYRAMLPQFIYARFYEK